MHDISARKGEKKKKKMLDIVFIAMHQIKTDT